MGFDGVFERFPWDTLFCAAHAETKEQRVIKLSDFQDDCTIAVLCSKPSTIRGRGRRGGGKEKIGGQVRANGSSSASHTAIILARA